MVREAAVPRPSLSEAAGPPVRPEHSFTPGLSPKVRSPDVGPHGEACRWAPTWAVTEETGRRPDEDRGDRSVLHAEAFRTTEPGSWASVRALWRRDLAAVRGLGRPERCRIGTRLSPPSRSYAVVYASCAGRVRGRTVRIAADDHRECYRSGCPRNPPRPGCRRRLTMLHPQAISDGGWRS
jgi:hypothetical protein